MTPISAPVAIATLPFSNLEIPPQPPQIQRSLEQGNVLYLPQLAFSLTAAEQGLLTPELVAPRARTSVINPTRARSKALPISKKPPPSPGCWRVIIR